MTSANDDDDKLRQSFQALRELPATPPFEAAWHAATARSRAPRVVTSARVAGVALLLTLGIVVTLLSLSRPPAPQIVRMNHRAPANDLFAAQPEPSTVPWRSSVLVSRWDSPTQVLLADAAANHTGSNRQTLFPANPAGSFWRMP